jgi:hypothetical protein
VEPSGCVDASLEGLHTTLGGVLKSRVRFGPEFRGRGSVAEIELEFYPSHHDVPTFWVKIACTCVVGSRLGAPRLAPSRAGEPVRPGSRSS